MYGFGQFAYNPGTIPNMQDRLTMGQQYNPQYRTMNSMSALNGRIVTGIEEAKASQIPLDGTISYFPSPAENVIYAKTIDMQGLPVFLVYELKMQESANQNQKNAKNIDFSEFDRRISAIEQKIKELTNNESTTYANANNVK